MATLKSKKLLEALKKARNVGRVEEAVTVDECPLVLRSLTPKDYEAIVDETAELGETLEYIQAYQMGHVCRSIIEIEGIDLRDVDFIEDEVPSGQYFINAKCSKSKAEEARKGLAAIGVDLTIVPPDEAEGRRTALIERHEWVRQQASTWSREVISVLYHKFTDVLSESEKRARDKVEFKVPDETNEDKFRRLLGEVKELAAQVPQDLGQKILDDAGFMRKSTPEELEQVARRAREFALEQAAKSKEEEAPVPVLAPASVTASVRVEEPPVLPPAHSESLPPSLHQELVERMKDRVPLNRTAVNASLPAQAPVIPPRDTRSAQIAALEGEQLFSDPGSQIPAAQYHEVVELSQNIPSVDGKGVKGLIDKPPIVGINPRFRPRT